MMTGNMPAMNLNGAERVPQGPSADYMRGYETCKAQAGQMIAEQSRDLVMLLAVVVRLKGVDKGDGRHELRVPRSAFIDVPIGGALERNDDLEHDEIVFTTMPAPPRLEAANTP